MTHAKFRIMATHAIRVVAPPAAEPPRSDRGRRIRRYIIAALGLLAIVALLAGLKAAQIARMIAFGKKAQLAGPPPETVSTVMAQQQSWEAMLSAVGSVTAARGVSISNEVAGTVWRIHFESGASVRQGDVLVELDSRVEQAQLASAREKRDLAATTVGRTRALVATGSISQAQSDTDESQVRAADADVNALAAQIDRKIVRAPFAGKLGIRLVNIGQYLAPGTAITVLESTDATYVDFSLPQQELTRVSVGMPVRIALDAGDAGAAPPPAEGSLFAVDPAIDPVTRNIKLRATVPAKNDWLRPGMFVAVSVIEPKQSNVVALPATAVVHASFGDSVFVVEDQKDKEGNVVQGQDGKPRKIGRQQFVRLGPTRGDFIAIADGVKVGDEVVVGGAFKLRNGAAITVNNEIDLHPELSPHPPNR